ncbi:MAG: hypothetical protein IPN33_22160 [Saprospiraceae bacterium]|nr:hypothetical protein [Saprospiraceae bacterium]
MVPASPGKGYAIGVDGTLLHTVNGGDNWITVPTGHSHNFKNVYFKTDTEGVAILETVAGQGQIYKTTNSGVTWTLISAAGDDYNDFYFYPNTTSNSPSEKGYAVSSDGKVKRLVMNGSYGLVNIVTTLLNVAGVPIIPSTTDLVSVYFSDANHGWVASGTMAYFTSNANSAATTWREVNPGLPAGVTIREIYFDPTFNSGIARTNTGALYRIQPSGLTYTFALMSGAGDNYVDIDDDATHVYGFDKTSGTVKKAQKSNLGAGLTTVGIALPAAANLVSINVQVSNTILTAGVGGDLFKGTATTWTDNSPNVSPLAIQDVQAAGINTIYAVGNEGTLLQTSNGSDWKTVPTATAVPFNALKFNTTPTVAAPATYAGLIAGDNGLLLRSAVTPGAVALTTILVATQENLYDVALNTANNAYVAGAHGTLVSIPNLLIATPVLAALKPAEDFRGLCFLPGSTAVYAVGDNAAVYQYNGASGAKIKAIYTPALRDVHFTNVQNGYIVGDKGTIRHTADGGTRWQYVLPVNASGGTTMPMLNGVWTTQAERAIIIGDAGYVGKISGTTLTYYNIGTTTNNLYDVAVKNGTGYIVGQGGAAYTTTNDGSTFSAMSPALPTTVTLRAIHIFQDNNKFMAVGDKKKIYCYNGAWVAHTAPALVNPNTVFTDVFFHDDRTGYVVGSGAPTIGSYVLRCSFDANIQTSGPTTDKWVDMDLKGTNGVAIPANVDVVTIDFATRYHGFLGGSFNTGIPTINYARLVNDETNLFSTRFWYDRLGRMVVSQNTKQFNRKKASALNLADYSYTRYDSLGRISEVGELTDNAGSNTRFSTIFGEVVNGLFNPDVISDTKLNAWINASNRREVTKTYYDETIITGLPITQENLRKRVATVTYEDVNDNNPQTYQHATHYSYDIHGNVKTLLQDTPALDGIQ